MSLICLLCFWSLALPTAGSAVATTAPANEIAVNKHDAVINRVMFSPGHMPAEMPKLKPGEAALTRANYECRAGIRYERVSESRIGDHWHAVEHILHVDVETRLTDTIFLPMMAPVLLRAHEEGHREMNERIYKEGDAAAHAAAADIMARNWEADGPTPDAAAKAATDAAVDQFCQAYLHATSDRASRLGAIYDHLTDHGRNQLYVANAIRLSFLEEKKLAASRPAELLHPSSQPAN